MRQLPDSGERSLQCRPPPWPDVLRALIAHGAQVNITRTDGRTPLHLATIAITASADCALECLRVLFASAADTSIAGAAGRTAAEVARDVAGEHPSHAPVVRAMVAVAMLTSA